MAAVRIALSILHQQGQFLKSRHFAVRPVALPGWGIRNLQHPDQFKSSRDQPEQQDSVDRDDQGKSDLLIDGHGDLPELCGRLVTRLPRRGEPAFGGKAAIAGSFPRLPLAPRLLVEHEGR